MKNCFTGMVLPFLWLIRQSPPPIRQLEYRITFLLKMITNGAASGKAFNFQLVDLQDRVRQMTDFKSKTVIIDFWYTGCGNCAMFYKENLSYVEEYFRKNKNVIFLSINIDKRRDVWKKSVINGLYTSLRTINLNTNGTGAKSKITDYYKISAYPTVILIDSFGNISSTDQIKLRDKNTLINEITTALKI